MSDVGLLVFGVVVFGLMLCGMVMTIAEFRRLSKEDSSNGTQGLEHKQ